jgi:septum formation protein
MRTILPIDNSKIDVPPLVLASGSKHRALLLKNAGLEFSSQAAKIDERIVEKPLLQAKLEPGDIALVLAEAKALDVSVYHPDAIIIGCDQTLSLDDVLFHKPCDMKAARQHLLALSGKTHQLNAGIVLVKNGKTLWRYVAVAHMTMRHIDPAFIGKYLADIGDAALGSVGSYQIEGRGIQLFDHIDGDYFTIIGLPLLPLLNQLRVLGLLHD